MAYSKAKLKSSGDKASPCFRPFWIGKLSDRCFNIFHTIISINSDYFPKQLKKAGFWNGHSVYSL
jgi:hypothetical protein